MKRPHINNFGDKLRRAGWLFLTALFIFTGLGVGVYAFYASTHQTDTNQAANSTTQPNNTTACSFSGAQSAAVMSAPAVYKTSGKTSNLQITDLQKGSGQTAAKGDCLLVKYYGTIANTGVKFDEDYTQPLALQFLVGEGYVIPGWDQGLIGMKVGGERRLVIPSNLGYGASGQCKTQDPNNPEKCADFAIPPNTDLVFVVKLLSIK
ncbi:MAG TPA: FKBP-type peptidyl-prolyl cis-trans isomerase [Candidatus Saccharimonadales bacterium]|nr:FKBP-type peptidyl-prolyl cis-trans isomerase [Candidatus Saccharimonadales bacterium]